MLLDNALFTFVIGHKHQGFGDFFSVILHIRDGITLFGKSKLQAVVADLRIEPGYQKAVGMTKSFHLSIVKL